jgi:hypothetical protein
VTSNKLTQVYTTKVVQDTKQELQDAVHMRLRAVRIMSSLPVSSEAWRIVNYIITGEDS